MMGLWGRNPISIEIYLYRVVSEKNVASRDGNNVAGVGSYNLYDLEQGISSLLSWLDHSSTDVLINEQHTDVEQ